MTTSQSWYVLCIDPSLNNTGYCVAKVSQPRGKYKVEIIELAHIPNKHFTSDRFGYKLNHIERRLYQLREVYRPSVVAKENLATRSHSQTEYLAPVHGIIGMVFGESAEIVGYSPTHIKQQCTGDGKAEKEDVAQSIQEYLLRGDINTDMNMLCFHTDDESDACAILVTLMKDKGIIELSN